MGINEYWIHQQNETNSPTSKDESLYPHFVVSSFHCGLNVSVSSVPCKLLTDVTPEYDNIYIFPDIIYQVRCMHIASCMQACHRQAQCKASGGKWKYQDTNMISLPTLWEQFGDDPVSFRRDRAWFQKMWVGILLLRNLMGTPQSPDLHSIGHLWDELKRRLRARPHHPKISAWAHRCASRKHTPKSCEKLSQKSWECSWWARSILNPTDWEWGVMKVCVWVEMDVSEVLEL